MSEDRETANRSYGRTKETAGIREIAAAMPAVGERIGRIMARVAAEKKVLVACGLQILHETLSSTFYGSARRGREKETVCHRFVVSRDRANPPTTSEGSPELHSVFRIRMDDTPRSIHYRSKLKIVSKLTRRYR